MKAALEIIIGTLYAIGAGHQGFFVLRNSREFFVDMADQAWLGPAQSFIEKVLVPNSTLITALVAIFEAVAALGILTRGAWVGPALIAGGVFSIVGALTGSPAESVGYGLLAALHFWLASGH